MKPRKVSMFGIVNWASIRENLGGGGGGGGGGCE